MKPLRLIAVWLLLLALPVQGLAAFTPASRCADAHAGHAMHDTQQHHGTAAQAHDHGSHQPQDDGQSTDPSGGHSCCHHVFSGVPSAAIPGMPAPPREMTARVSLLATLYIPELPQRPPRA
jgi:hypothetical protein